MRQPWTIPRLQTPYPDQTFRLGVSGAQHEDQHFPSEFNSNDRGSREHDSAHDATKSLVDYLGSNDGQTFLVSHAWLCREPGKRSRHLTESLSRETSFPKPSVSLQKRRRTLCAPSLPETRTKGPKRPNLLTMEDYENQAPPQKCLRRIRPSGTRGGRDKRTCQPKLVRARSPGLGTLRALQQPSALGIASWSRLSDTASTVQSPIFFSDYYTVFSTRIQWILRILASVRTLAVMLAPAVSSLSVARNHRPSRSATRSWGLPAL